MMTIGVVAMLAGCASAAGSTETTVVQASGWHAVKAPGSTLAVQSGPAEWAGHPLRVGLICNNTSAAVPGITLALESDPDADLLHPTAMRVENTRYQDIAWNRYTSGIDHIQTTGTNSGLARAVASAYKSQTPLVLIDADQNRNLTIELTGSPYGSPLARFLTRCPDTARQLPELVRISKAKLIKAPKDFGFSGFRHHGATYPESALKAGHEGAVTVRYAVSPQGEVLWPYVTKSSGYPELDRAARDGVRDFVFPASELPKNAFYIKTRQLTFAAPR